MNEEESWYRGRAQQFSQYTDKITGNWDTIYDVLCVYAYLGDNHDGRIWGSAADGTLVTAWDYLHDYMHVNCTHSKTEPTTLEERALYAVDYVERHVIEPAKRVFGEDIFNVYTQTAGATYGNINVYNADGSVNQDLIELLEDELQREFRISRCGCCT